MIPYGRQSINWNDRKAVVRALKSDLLTNGPLVQIFEKALEAEIGAPCAVVSSGTAALHCAYAAIGLKEGDEIITPPLTFIATQATAALMGAKVKFADVQSDTGNIDPKLVSSLITRQTKAIVAVDFAGHPADLNELRQISDKYGIYLIEDAAHSLGSKYRNKQVGTIADLTTFSFFPTKNITTAEGGAVAALKPELLERARKFSRQGLIRTPANFQINTEGPWHQEVQEFGLNYRLPDVLCALGISQLARLNKFKKRREEIFYRYSVAFGNNREIQIPEQRSYVDPVWHLYPLRVDPKRRKFIFESLRNSGIGVQVNYLPAHMHPVFRSLNLAGSLPNAEEFYSKEISLPMSAKLKNSEISMIIQKVNRFTQI